MSHATRDKRCHEGNSILIVVGIQQIIPIGPDRRLTIRISIHAMSQEKLGVDLMHRTMAGGQRAIRLIRRIAIIQLIIWLILLNLVSIILHFTVEKRAIRRSRTIGWKDQLVTRETPARIGFSW